MPSFSSSGEISLSKIKNYIYKSDSDYFLDKLSTSSKKNCTAAWSIRAVNSSWSGPAVNVRRGSDNATSDFYADSVGNLGTEYNAGGTSLLSWLGGYTGYVTRMYDQSGNGRDIIQDTTANQPTIGPVSVLDTISSSGNSAVRGVYALYRAKMSYTGPTIKLRRGTDNALQDFYADILGNLGTGLNATGTLVSEWGRDDSLYVDTWYDQSGNGFHATQATTGSQPSYSFEDGSINFGSPTNAFLNMGTAASGPIPTGTLNAQYTIVSKIGYLGAASTNGNQIVAAGGTTTNTANGLGAYYNQDGTHYWANWWWGNDYQITNTTNSPNPEQNIAAKYNGATRYMYINGTSYSSAGSGYTASVGQQYIGRSGISTGYLNSKLYHVFIFNTAITDNDIITMTTANIAKPGTNNDESYNLYKIMYYDRSFMYLTTGNTEYPPVGSISSSNNTSVVSGTYADGTYITSSSSTSNAISYDARHAFQNDSSLWESATSRYSLTTGNYTGGITTTVGSTNYSGEWLQIQLPNQISLKSFSLRAQHSQTCPRRFVIAGSNDGSTWDLVHLERGVTWDTTSDKYFVNNSNNFNTYSYYRIIILEISNSYTSTLGAVQIRRFKLNPTLPLTNGSKEYTYLTDIKKTNYAGSSSWVAVFEQNVSSGGLVTGARSCLLINRTDNRIGLNGEGNDAMVLGKVGINRSHKVAMVVNHNYSTLETYPDEGSYNVKLWIDGYCSKAATTSPSTNTVASGGFYVGKKYNDTEYFVGEINEIIVINKVLTENEVMTYYKPINNSILKNRTLGRIIPKTVIDYAGPTPNPIRKDCVIKADMKESIPNLNDASQIYQWGDFSQVTSLSARPTYNIGISNTQGAGGVSNNEGFMDFSSANSQHMSAGSRTFNIDTNGGFTAIACVKMKTNQNWQRVFDIGSGQTNNNILIGLRTSSITVDFYNGASVISSVSSNFVPSNNTWFTVMCRYNKTGLVTELWVNGVRFAGVASVALTNRTLSNTYIGRSNWGSDPYLNACMSGIYIFDKYLTNTECNAISDYLMYQNYKGIPKQVNTNYNNVIIRERGLRYSGYPTVYYNESASYIKNSVYYPPSDSGSYTDMLEVPCFPISFSFWMNANSTGFHRPFSLTDSADSQTLNIEYDTISSAAQPLRIWAALPTPTLITSYALSLSTWCHITVTISSSYQVKVYINGALQTTHNGTSAAYGHNRITIGKSYDGFIADARLFDYVLRLDEVAELATTFYNVHNFQSTYQNPSMYLVNKNKWYTQMTSVQNGTYNPTTNTGTDPYKIYTLVDNVTNTGNQWYHNTRIQDYKSFTLSVDLKVNNSSGSGGDGFYIFIGGNQTNDLAKYTTNYGSQSSATKPIVINFQMYKSNTECRQGVYLIKNTKNVAYGSCKEWLYDNSVYPVTVTYTKGLSSTWVINVGGEEIIRYDDTQNDNWLSISGSYWGIGANTGGATSTINVSSLELSYIPSDTSSISCRSLGAAGSSLGSLRNNAMFGLIPGMTSKVYDGWSNGDITWGTTRTYRSICRTSDTSNIINLTNGYMKNNASVDAFTVETEGWFVADATGDWTFALTTINDSLKLYIDGVLLLSTVTSGTKSMIAGTSYKVNIYYSNNTTDGEMGITFTPPGGVATSDWSNYIYSSTGTNSLYPAESAKVIKDLTGTNTDGVYYINSYGTSAATYCLMNDTYDGGGWMLLMKGTRGTAFNYSSNAWTAINALNTSDVTRMDGDAKYEVFNSKYVKDVMVIWPDIPSNGYTNIWGKSGGSLYLEDGWCWKVENWNGDERTTALAGFQSNRRPGGNTTAGVDNPFRFSGFSSSIWSNQSGTVWHGFNGGATLNGGATMNVRWGFIFNNEGPSNYASVDAYGGIGMSSAQGGSGDWNNGLNGVVSGINRTARFELWGR
jgi:hypothetical protein